MSESDTFSITTFDPVKYRGQMFGEAILFDNAKQQIRFGSKFHAPDYLSYSQITRIEVQHDRKNWLLWVGILTFMVIVGLFLLIARIHLPPWKITIYQKKDAPIVIRARLTEYLLGRLLTYPQVPVQLIQGKKNKE